jgi:hypothetical protein
VFIIANTSLDRDMETMKFISQNTDLIAENRRAINENRELISRLIELEKAQIERLGW